MARFTESLAFSSSSRAASRSANSNDKHTTGAQAGGGLKYYRAERLAVYHNTFWNNGTVDDDPQQNYDGGDRGGITSTVIDVSSGENDDIVFVNNIVGKVQGLENSHVIQFYEVDELSRLDYNVYYGDSPFVTEFHIGTDSPYSWSTYQGLSGIDETNSEYVSASVPPVDDTNHVPISGRAADDAAGPTALVSYGQTSSTVYTDTPWVFHEDDTVSFDGVNGTAVMSVGSNYITVNSTVTVSTGDPIWLRRNYVIASDIGAVDN